jgi:hypothetical protein
MHESVTVNIGPDVSCAQELLDNQKSIVLSPYLKERKKERKKGTRKYKMIDQQMH